MRGFHPLDLSVQQVATLDADDYIAICNKRANGDYEEGYIKLSDLVSVLTGAGVVVSNFNLIADAPPGPTPSDPGKVWHVTYRDGSDAQTWDPEATPPAWI